MAGNGPALMTPQEVAQTFRVDPKTVTRWAKKDKLTSIRTLGGHRRYLEDEVMGLLHGMPLTPLQVAALRAQLGGAR